MGIDTSAQKISSNKKSPYKEDLEQRKDSAWSALSKVIANNNNTSTDNTNAFVIKPHVASSTYVDKKVGY